MPSRLTIFSTSRTMASVLPQVNFSPSVSVGVNSPFSKHSMAKATVPPTEMVSMPARLSSSLR